MAKYLILIYESEADWEAAASPEVFQRVMDAHNRFPAQVEALGAKIVSGRALQPTTTATTVRVRDGKTLTTDGPFAETREQLGGYYLVEARDLDTALAIAARIPGARTGSIEVRPVMVYD